MKNLTKNLIAILVGAATALVLVTGSLLDVNENNQNPGYEFEVGNVTELFESPTPTPEPEVSVAPSPTRSIVPPRTLPPDPENPENGGGMGGSAPRPTNDYNCTVRCSSKAP